MYTLSRRMGLAIVLLLVPGQTWAKGFHLSFHPRVAVNLGAGGRPAIARERAQLVEVSLRIKDLAPCEALLLQARLQTRLEAEVREVEALSRQGPEAAPGVEEPAPVRVLKVVVQGRRNPYEGAGPARTGLLRMGRGAVLGAAVGAFALCQTDSLALAPTLEILGGTTVLGGLAGLATTPHAFRANRALAGRMGYLPWIFRVKWQVATRRPGQPDRTFAQGAETLPLLAYLAPLAPEALGKERIRRENLRAGLEALVANLGEKQNLLSSGQLPL